MMLQSWAMTALCLFSFVSTARGHAYLGIPISRNWLAHFFPQNGQPTEYCQHCKSGGGVGGTSSIVPTWPYPETAATARRHGVCGDPAGPNQQYAASGPITAEYSQGQVVTLEVAVSTHHRGHFEVFICDMATVNGSEVTSECLLRTPLMRDPTDTAVSPPDLRQGYRGRYYLEPRCATDDTAALYSAPLNSSALYTRAHTTHSSMQRMRMRYVLPSALTCQHCVLQWWYVTANSCNPPGYSDRTWPTLYDSCSGDGPGRGWWGPTLSLCGNTYPEEFWNCADVAIASAGPTPPTAAPTRQPTAQPTAPTATTTAAPTDTEAPTNTPAPTSPPPPTPSFTMQTSLWEGGCQVTLQLTHTTVGSTWTLALAFGGGPVRAQVWNAELQNLAGGVLTLTNAEYNGMHTVGDALSIGFNLYGPSNNCFPLTSAALNGVQVSIPGITSGTTITPGTTAAPPGSASPTAPPPPPTNLPPPPPPQLGQCPPIGWNCAWPPVETAPCCSQYGYPGSDPAFCSNGGLDSRASGCCSSNGTERPLTCGTASSGFTCRSTPSPASNVSSCTGDTEVDAILHAANIPAAIGLDSPSAVYTWAGMCSALRQLRAIGRGTGSVPSTTGVDLGMYSMTRGGNGVATRNRALANIASMVAQAAWESGGEAPWTACDENNYINSATASCTQRADGQRYDSLNSAISCPVDLNMRMTAETYAAWTPGPMECTPGTATAGCCWWGRGAIQTTGPHNYAALQRDVVANMTSLTASVDLCTNPEAICQHTELKWVGALYYWTSVVQTDACFNATLEAYADADGFHPCASVAGCLSFNRGTGGKVNNGIWNRAAHGEAGRIAYFERIMGAIARAVNQTNAAPTSPTASPTSPPATEAPTPVPTPSPTMRPTQVTAAPVTVPSGAVNYHEIIRLSNLFYDAQKTGALPADVKVRVPWRRDSFINDGADVGLNLSGGFFDAGDYVKFGLPAASSMTLLAWSAIDFRAGYPTAELSRMLVTLRWFADYIVRAHPNNNTFYGQVGDGDVDHSVMCRPDECTDFRPSYVCTPTAPCSDLAAETAAALSAIAMALNANDPAFAATLVPHAVSLYDFATNHRGLYHTSITDAASFYRSGGDSDEMGWGAAWLYRLTGEVRYLNTAEAFAANLGHGGEQSWDQKAPALHVMLYGLTLRTAYRNKATQFMRHWMPGGSVTYLQGGLAWLRQWGPLRYSANAAFIGLVYSTYLNGADQSSANQYVTWSQGQIDYMVGSNPSNFSYLIGYGSSFPRQPHHKASTCGPAPAPCGWAQFNDISIPNFFTLYGALVGGPDANEQYRDVRTDYIMNEVALDYSAGFTAAAVVLSSLNPSGPPPPTTATPTVAPTTQAPTVATTPAPPTTALPPTTTGAPTGGISCYNTGRFACNATSEVHYITGYTEQWCTASCYNAPNFHPACVFPDVPGAQQIPNSLTKCLCGCVDNPLTTSAPAFTPVTTSAPTFTATEVPLTTAGVSAQVTYTIDRAWNFGCTFTIRGGLSVDVTSWTLAITMNDSNTPSQTWNARMTSASGQILFQNVGWNAVISANGIMEFGGQFDGVCPRLVSATVNGHSATIHGDIDATATQAPYTSAPTRAPMSAAPTATTTRAPVEPVTAAPTATIPTVNATLSHSTPSLWLDECQFIVRSTLSIPVASWTVELNMNPAPRAVQVWDGELRGHTAAGIVTVTNEAGNGHVAAFGVISFSGIWDHEGQCPTVQSATVNGYPATVAAAPLVTMSPARPPTISTPTSPPSPAAPTASLGNPFLSNSTWYVNPTYTINIDRTLVATTDQATRCTLQGMHGISSAYWIDVKAKAIVTNTSASDTSHAHGILEHSRALGGQLVTFIIYDLPNRDCHAYASMGEICCEYLPNGRCNYDAVANNCRDGLAEYRTTYIDPLFDLFANYSDIPIVLIIEPDSLPNLATNLGDSRCSNPATMSAYQEGIRYAIQQFARLSHTTIYLDGAHGGWLGWANNAREFANIVAGLQVSHLLRGFATNVANYQPLGQRCPIPAGESALTFCTPSGSGTNHPCCTADPCNLQGQYNSAVHEYNYVAILDEVMSAAMAGFRPQFIIDTGRNGVSNARSSCSNWCNIRGAGIGHIPTAADLPDPRVDALLWLKTPGESDGCSQTLPTGGRCPRYDEMCGSVDSLGARVDEPFAPEAGHWFTYQIQQLAANAHSTVPDSCATSTAAPTAAPPSPSPCDVTITTAGISFSPNSVTITVGQTVCWTPGSGHSVEQTTAAGSCTAVQSPSFGTTATGTAVQHTFIEAGAYFYKCGPHCSFGMTGQVVVTAVSTTSAANTFDATGAPVTSAPTSAPTTLAPTAPQSGVCGAGTAFDNGACIAHCGQGTRLDATLGQCVPDCNDLRRRDIDCPSCNQPLTRYSDVRFTASFPGDLNSINRTDFVPAFKRSLANRLGISSNRVVNVTVRSGSIIASANIEAATAAEGIHFEAVAQQRDLSVALPEGIIVRATSVDVDLPLASTVEEEDPPSEGSSNSGAGGATVTTGVIAAVIAVTLVAVVIAAVARRRRHRKVRVESFTKQDGPRGFDTAEFSGGAKTDTFRLASNSAANTITMTRMPRVSTISVLSEGTELESISIPRSSLVTSVADDEDAFTVSERDGSLRLESVRRMNLASNETDM